jgi:hypothetical protein
MSKLLDIAGFLKLMIEALDAARVEYLTGHAVSWFLPKNITVFPLNTLDSGENH